MDHGTKCKDILDEEIGWIPHGLCGDCGYIYGVGIVPTPSPTTTNKPYVYDGDFRYVNGMGLVWVVFQRHLHRCDAYRYMFFFVFFFWCFFCVCLFVSFCLFCFMFCFVFVSL